MYFVFSGGGMRCETVEPPLSLSTEPSERTK